MTEDLNSKYLVIKLVDEYENRFYRTSKFSEVELFMNHWPESEPFERFGDRWERIPKEKFNAIPIKTGGEVLGI